MSKKLKSIFLAFIMGILLSFAGVALAQAEDYTSAIAYFGPYAGYSYWNDCSICCDSNNSYLWGFADVHSESGNVPQDYMGLSAYVYAQDGVCVSNTPWTYNSVSTDSWSTGDTSDVSASGYYYCNGLSESWNGSSYSSDWSYATNPLMWIS